MTLIVPEYVLAQRAAKQKAEKDAEQKSLKDRMPQPTGWRILVMPYMGKEKTDGGVYVPDKVRERESRATVVAYVVKLGYLHPQLEDIAGRHILLLSDGTSQLDMTRLEWSHLPRPTWPLDKDFQWSAAASLYGDAD